MAEVEPPQIAVRDVLLLICESHYCVSEVHVQRLVSIRRCGLNIRR